MADRAQEAAPSNAVAEMALALAALDCLVSPEPQERAAYLDTPAALRDSAVAYAAAGWPVLPLEVGGKVALLPSWQTEASTDPDTVAGWWTQPYNIGVRTGVRFDVIDIDADKGGFESWAAFLTELGAAGHPPPDVLAVAQTGRGGRHLLITPVPGSRNGVNLGGKVGVDYRADGGYIVVPPSRLTDGDRYRWVIAPDQRLLG